MVKLQKMNIEKYFLARIINSEQPVSSKGFIFANFRNCTIQGNMFAKKLLDPESSDGHVYVYTPDRVQVYCVQYTERNFFLPMIGKVTQGD